MENSQNTNKKAVEAEKLNNKKLSTQPYKGTRDFYPDQMQIQNYIFDTWKKVCAKYGYQQYSGPFLESFEIYAAKTGEEIVNEQLYSFEDKGGRKLAIRPEMTPTVARMVGAQYKTLQKPIRWFSFPNLWRYEKPQRGRLREHYQLNVDIFGVDSINADFEIINVAISTLLEFGATKDMFTVKIGNRRLIEDVYKHLDIGVEQGHRVSKALDKIHKISQEKFIFLLKEDAKLLKHQIDAIIAFLDDSTEIIALLKNQGSQGAKEIFELLQLFEQNYPEYKDLVNYDPTMIRGFDYYTGTVFEVFDTNPNNNRSLFGGGRYDDLVGLFIDEKIPGVGFGMGDVTLLNFLENWELLPNFKNSTEYLVTVWPQNPQAEQQEQNGFLTKSIQVAKNLREQGKNVQLWPETNTKLDKQLKYADKNNIQFVVIIGENELKNNQYTLKNMKTREQQTIEI